MRRLAKRTMVEGIIVNGPAGLFQKEQQMLKDEFPGTDIASCYLVDQGETPMPLFTLALIGVIGAVVAIAGVSLIRRRPKLAGTATPPPLPAATPPPLPSGPGAPVPLPKTQDADPLIRLQNKSNPYAGDDTR